jgi:hypothetical protein
VLGLSPAKGGAGGLTLAQVLEPLLRQRGGAGGTPPAKAHSGKQYFSSVSLEFIRTLLRLAASYILTVLSDITVPSRYRFTANTISCQFATSQDITKSQYSMGTLTALMRASCSTCVARQD